MAMTGGISKLVHTGYCDGNTNAPIKVYVYYKSVQSDVSNTSTVHCGMYVDVASGWSIGAWSDFNYGSYIGTTSNTFDGDIPNFSGRRWLVENKSFQVQHNNNGEASATIYWKWGAYSTWGKIEAPSGSFTITLPTIKRGASIESAKDMILGRACDISWTPINSSHKYRIKLSLGNWNVTLPSTSSYIEPNSTATYKYSDYVISGTETANGTTIYNELPNSPYGNMSIALITYGSDGKEIGTNNSTFKVVIPDDVVPTVGDITLTPETITLLSGSSSTLLVKGRNKLNISVSGSTAGTGSTIKSYSFSGQNVSMTGTSASITSTSVINPSIKEASVALTYTVTVTDHRGRSASASKTITCYNYAAPLFSSFTVSDRVVENGVAKMTCTYKITYHSVNSTNKINSLQIYGAKSTINCSGWSTTTSNGIVTASGSTTINLGTDNTSVFNVYAVVKDDYGSSKQSQIKTAHGESRIINITPNGTGIAVGKMAKQNEMFDCRWPANFDDTITAKYGRFVTTTDAGPYIQNNVPLRVGDASGQHIDFDGNEIVSKQNATTPGPLYLNGSVIGLYVWDSTDNGNDSDDLTLYVTKDSTSRCVVSLPTYNRSYESSPNMYITSYGTFGRSASSSRRYKTDISDVKDNALDPYNVLNIPVRQFKYNKDNIPVHKNIEDTYIGFIAEEVEQAYPAAAEYDEDGRVEMWNIKVIVPAMLKIMQDQQKEINELKAEIEQLKK